MVTEALLDDVPLLSYAETITGATVRGGHTITRFAAASIVALARPARRVAMSSSLAASAEFTFGYVRSHSAIKQLWLRWVYWPDPDVFTSLPTISVSLTIRDELGNSIAPPSSVIPLGFDGTSIVAVRGDISNAAFIGAAGYIDLDAAAATLTGSSWSFSFTWTRSSGNVTLDHIEAWECPRTQVDTTDDYGATTGPVNPGNPIIAGSTTTTGYERFAKTVEGAIACGRTLLSVAWHPDTSVAPVTTSASFTAFTRMLEGGTTPWTWYVRPRVVYAPSSGLGESARFRVYYQVTGGGTGKVRMTTGSSADPFTSPDLTSATWAWSDWTDCKVPTNGTDRVAGIQFTGRTTAGALYVAGIQLEEATT